MARDRIRQEKIDFLKSVEIFDQFTRNSIKHMTKLLTRRSFKRGQWLYKEGERAGKVYLVMQGEFKVFKKFALVSSTEDKLVMDNTGHLVKRKLGKVKLDD